MPPNDITPEDVAREMKGKIVERPLEPAPDCPPGFVRVRDPKTGTVWAVLKEHVNPVTR